MNKKNIGMLLVCMVLPQLAGFIGSIFTTPNIPTWYEGLTKPELAPPNWVFFPVWTILFLMMGVALYLVWREGVSKWSVKIALTFFFVQLALNTLWSIIFFGMQNPGLALIEIAFLWSAIALTIYTFFKVNKFAAYLLIPYLLWVSFASYLNYMIWVLN